MKVTCLCGAMFEVSDYLYNLKPCACGCEIEKFLQKHENCIKKQEIIQINTNDVAN